MSQALDLFKLTPREALAIINKKYGANTVVLASKAAAAKGASRVSTGIFALDCGLGGGWPEGRIIELHGPYSSFKSTTSLVSVASFQRKYPETCDSPGFGIYIDLERTVDLAYAVKLGVDLDRLVIVNPDSGEQAVNVINDLVTLNCPLFTVLDSLAALVPTAEIEASIDQAQMGVQARLVNRMMRVLTARMRRDLYDNDVPKVTLLVLNQMRQKVGVVFGNPEFTPGGIGKDFAYSVIVCLRASASKALTENVTVNGIKREVQVGQVVRFKVVKNKCGGPQRHAGEFVFYERDWGDHKKYTFNNIDTMFEYGAFTNVIRLRPNVGYEFLGVKGKNEKAFKTALMNSPKVWSSLRRQIIFAMKDLTLALRDDQ